MISKQQRRSRIDGLKNELRQFKVLSKNSMQVEEKEEKIRYRRQSLQLADPLHSQTLLRKFSDEDEEEEKSTINTFNEKYLVRDKIGEGSNGVVYTCDYRLTGKTYAVKMITMDQQHILELKRNFLSIRMLRHPNIIKYYALYFDLKKHLAYLIMEYFPFKNMTDLAISDEGELRIVFNQLLTAINHIHERNICHRDIKPENIIYDPFSKRVKIIDFGISRRTFQRGQRRDMLTIIGTPQYLAPEILTGGGYDQRVDMWSTGVTLYKLIAKVSPFECEYHADTVNKITKGKVTFQQTVWEKYSFFAKDFIMRLLKPKEERLSARQALRHLWISQGSSSKLRKGSQQHQQNKIPRNESFNLRIFKTFNEQNENLNLWHATSKEQGYSALCDEFRPKVNRMSLSFIQNKEFDLDDSSEQQDSSPSTVNSKDNEHLHKKI